MGIVTIYDRLTEVKQLKEGLLKGQGAGRQRKIGTNYRTQLNNTQWRIIFQWSERGAENVAIVDYH